MTIKYRIVTTRQDYMVEIQRKTSFIHPWSFVGLEPDVAKARERIAEYEKSGEWKPTVLWESKMTSNHRTTTGARYYKRPLKWYERKPRDSSVLLALIVAAFLSGLAGGWPW